MEKRLGQVWTSSDLIEFMLSKIELKGAVKVLEPACGVGNFISPIIAKFPTAQIDCVDIDENVLNIARSKFSHYKNINFYHCDFLKDFEGSNYDLIISNPPFIRVQNLPEEYREFLRNNFRFCFGDTDIFYAFLEKSISLLADGGYLAFIIPNSFIQSKAGKIFRQYLIDTQYETTIYDFDYEQLFGNVAVYICILILRKARGLYSYYRYVDGRFVGGSIAWEKLQDFGIINNDLVNLFRSQPLKVGTIRAGIITLKNSVYIFVPDGEDEKYYYLSNGFRIEKQITLDIVKLAGIKGREDILKNKKKIIYPYKQGKIISEDELKTLFPEAYRYLEANKSVLLSRDRGKFNNVWYAYGRQQGIKSLFGEKILFPHIAQEINFVYCPCDKMLYYGGYAIFNPPYDYEITEKILNSKIVKDYLYLFSRPFKNNWRGYTKSSVQNLKLPFLTDDEIKTLYSLQDKNDIDKFVEEIYKANIKS